MANHCLQSTDYINVIVSDKQSHLQYTTMEQAIVHCTKGIDIWPKVSNDEGTEPDVSGGLRRRTFPPKRRWRRWRSCRSTSPRSSCAS